MSKVFSAHAVSVDGYISGRTPDGAEEFGRGLGDAPMLFDWYFDGDTPSQVFDGFKLSEPSARFFDAIAARVLSDTWRKPVTKTSIFVGK